MAKTDFRRQQFSKENQLSGSESVFNESSSTHVRIACLACYRSMATIQLTTERSGKKRQPERDFLAQIHSIGRLKHALYTAEDEMPRQRPLPASKVHNRDTKAQLTGIHHKERGD
jgi:hypothetical protein